MKNLTVLYSIIGILVGFVLTSFYFRISPRVETNNYRSSQSNGMMMHQMPDGSMVGGMDMGGAVNSMMSGLNGKTGDAFDKAFLSEMIVHHQGAVVMAQAVLKNSRRPELIKLANDIISAQTGEINMMKTWQKNWFNIQN
mgnify:CR=1 FL=1